MCTGRSHHTPHHREMPGKRQVILFGRYPAPGRTKTRLIPALGPVGAADLQRRLTETSLSDRKSVV